MVIYLIPKTFLTTHAFIVEPTCFLKAVKHADLRDAMD